MNNDNRMTQEEFDAKWPVDWEDSPRDVYFAFYPRYRAHASAEWEKAQPQKGLMLGAYGCSCGFVIQIDSDMREIVCPKCFTEYGREDCHCAWVVTDQIAKQQPQEAGEFWRVASDEHSIFYRGKYGFNLPEQSVWFDKALDQPRLVLGMASTKAEAHRLAEAHIAAEEVVSSNPAPTTSGEVERKWVGERSNAEAIRWITPLADAIDTQDEMIESLKEALDTTCGMIDATDARVTVHFKALTTQVAELRERMGELEEDKSRILKRDSEYWLRVKAHLDGQSAHIENLTDDVRALENRVENIDRRCVDFDTQDSVSIKGLEKRADAQGKLVKRQGHLIESLWSRTDLYYDQIKALEEAKATVAESDGDQLSGNPGELVDEDGLEVKLWHVLRETEGDGFGSVSASLIEAVQSHLSAQRGETKENN